MLNYATSILIFSKSIAMDFQFITDLNNQQTFDYSNGLCFLPEICRERKEEGKWKVRLLISVGNDWRIK